MSSAPLENSVWRPTANWDTLRTRAQLLTRLRAFFMERGFLEVETPLLSSDVVVDRYIDPLPVVMPPDPRRPDAGPTYWLQTSPEFAMKRLLAAGGEAIFQVAKAFRGAERGPLHNPEFTLIEWYRRDDDLAAGCQLLSDVAEVLLARGPAERVSYRQAFQALLKIDPLTIPVEDLVVTAKRLEVTAPDSLVTSARGLTEAEHLALRDDWLDLLLTTRIMPELGRQRPTILFDYPASQAALARVREETPPVAERFELFVDGIELANGYHELLDPEPLIRRNRHANEVRRADGRPSLPEESRLLAAMQAGLPPSSGCALGFDRAVMIATGAQTIAEVIPFPHEIA